MSDVISLFIHKKNHTDSKEVQSDRSSRYNHTICGTEQGCVLLGLKRGVSGGVAVQRVGHKVRKLERGLGNIT